MANPASGQADHDLAVTRRLNLDAFDDDGLAEFARDDGFGRLTHGAAVPARHPDGDWPVQRRNARVKLLPDEKPSR